ncbi:hypothetical protein INT43_004964 [Umbelopsis isabellina]|uniref:Ribonucleases P/MRP subunit Pop8-like domain-containing protein n=1 Tax=Mortierella isabellina TaxID=91625 RepID=A0A8H7PEE8_MORIS|nr:hypothetical protein INT43_004964 [Umbelopsis isabellina]
MSDNATLAASGIWKRTIAVDDWHYMKFSVASSDNLNGGMEELAVRMQIAHVLEAGFGIVGSSAHIDVLQWNSTAHTGILRVSHSESAAVWNALSMATFKVDGKLCTFRIIDSSAHLISLSSNSRQYTF